MPLARREEATAALADPGGSETPASLSTLANYCHRVILAAALKGGTVMMSNALEGPLVRVASTYARKWQTRHNTS